MDSDSGDEHPRSLNGELSMPSEAVTAWVMRSYVLIYVDSNRLTQVIDSHRINQNQTSREA